MQTHVILLQLQSFDMYAMLQALDYSKSCVGLFAE